MAKYDQYPKDYNPPNKGKCETCAYPTKAWDPRWTVLCPAHWQLLGH